MKNKKGFTLIELLAVIVVLAIIALIATPIVMNTIKNAKKGAAERSADNYVKAVEQKVASSRIDGTKIANGTYNIQPDGNLCPASGCGENDKDKITIDMSGTKPVSGTIKISNGEVSSTDTTMTVGDYNVKYNQEKSKYEATEKGNTSVTYKNGEAVYFNVTTGEKCSPEYYLFIKGQSSTGVKSGCMKFYAFNDDGGDTVNLLLDHNTSERVDWLSKEDYIATGGEDLSNDGGACQYGGLCSSNGYGPLTLLDQLKNDTDEWKGTITPSNYTMDQSTQTSKAKYTIDYSGYKARLITAQEVAQITGNTTWDERTFYFDTKTSSQSATCKSGNTSGCKYGWLYDRTNKGCTTYGCLNNSDQETYGYWTASSYAGISNYAMQVNYEAKMTTYPVIDSILGVRPVITVLKSKLS